jgi:hypothetical protein
MVIRTENYPGNQVVEIGKGRACDINGWGKKCIQVFGDESLRKENTFKIWA